MRKIILLIFIVLASCSKYEDVFGGTYYVSKSGNNGNAGTYAAPWLTWQYAFNELSAGDTLFIVAGEYFVTGAANGTEWNGVYVADIDGTAADKIVVQNYNSGTVILNCEGLNPKTDKWTRGLKFSGCDYWHVIGITVRRVPEKGECAAGIYIEDCDHFTMERCVAKHNAGPGFVVNNVSDYTYFINCDSWGNVDGCDAGGFGDGFIVSHYDAGNANGGNYHTFFSGCRAWWNSDDGFDAFVSDANNTGGYVYWENCWAWKNGRNSGNGAGIKFAGGNKDLQRTGVQRVVNNCLSFDNKAIGFDQSALNGGSPEYLVVFYNNTSYRNGSQGIYNDYNVANYFRNNISYGNTGSNFYEDYGGTSLVTKDHNSWQSGYGYTMSSEDFLSTDTTGVSGARQSDGSLPDLDFLKLAPNSDLIDKGVLSVGYGLIVKDYYGSAPDLGALESGEEPPEPPIVDSLGTGIVVRGTSVVSSSGKLVKKQ